MTVPVNSDQPSHMTSAFSGSKYLLDLTKEERCDNERQKSKGEAPDTAEMQTSSSNAKVSNAAATDCDYWNVSRLSVDRRYTKSVSPIPMTTHTVIPNNSSNELSSNRVSQFCRQNDTNQLNYTDDISKHIHYIFNRNSQSVDNPDRISLLTSHTDPANTSQNQSYAN